jgi:hypothetical protein
LKPCTSVPPLPSPPRKGDAAATGIPSRLEDRRSPRCQSQPPIAPRLRFEKRRRPPPLRLVATQIVRKAARWVNAIVFDAKLVGNDPPHAQSDFPIRARSAKLNELIIRYWRKSRLKPSARSRIANEHDSDDQQKNDQPTSHVDLSNLRLSCSFPIAKLIEMTSGRQTSPTKSPICGREAAAGIVAE